MGRENGLVLATGMALGPQEREIISRELARDPNVTVRYLGRLLGRDFSGIAKEIARNGGRADYRATAAQERCDSMRARPRLRKLERSQQLHDVVNEGLAQKWSPQQIAKRLKADHPEDLELRVSHETIYECLYLQARGELRTQLKQALRSGRTRRVGHDRTPQPRGQIVGMVNISERPKEADDRAVPGFWEGDLIIGKSGKSQIATLVERTTRFTILVRIPYDRTAERVATLLALKMQTLPDIVKNSITWDQGKEMAHHADFTMRTGLPIYFCDPHSPWQRGTNENTNGLLRQYFPKGTDLSLHTDADLDKVAAELNGRPRQTLGWRKPIEVFTELLESDTVDMTT